ncbi:MAG: peptidoglycan-binding protein [Prevotellaceae bacterium]|jgi:hypothetical protein|nr:peptidoglycan-binding protein [Prevotellaceae bacterium]
MKKGMFILLIVIVAGFCIYYFVFRFDPLRDPAEFPLKVGSKGAEVAALQQALNAYLPTSVYAHLAPLPVTGIYDEQTDNAVRALYSTALTRDRYNELLALITP